jgi:putative spermidine/putrescine transport system substrate-binding protein/spermidine/putrescine transport system substrate-binding protein
MRGAGQLDAMFSSTIAERLKSLLLIVLLFILCALTSCERERPTLKLLVWEGYADPSVIGPFEEEHGCTIRVSYFNTSDDLLKKLIDRKNDYDVISPSSDITKTIMDSNLVLALDLAKIPTYSQTSQTLRNMDYLVQGKASSLWIPFVSQSSSIYGVPFMWGPNVLLYNTAVFKQKPPTSWSILWDPQYRGRVSVWDDISTLYMAAQAIGLNHPDPNAIYHLTDQQLHTVVEKLQQLKPNIAGTWPGSHPEELAAAFRRKEVVVAMGWPMVASELLERGKDFPIAQVIPDENTTGWIDHLMITVNSKHRELAYEFLDYMIQENSQRRTAQVTGYMPANEAAASAMRSTESSEDYRNKIKTISFWQDLLKRRQEYMKAWDRSGLHNEQKLPVGQ